LKNGKIGYDNEELSSSVQKSRELLREKFPTLISREELMLILYLKSRKKHLKKTGMTL
jgi:hypothetical protein